MVPATTSLNRFLDHMLTHGIGRANYERYFDSLGLRGDERVLDVGAGSGGCTRQLARLVPDGHVVSLDVSEYWSDLARHYLGDPPNVEFVVGNAASATFGPDTFDVANVHFMLHDVDAPDREPLMRNVSAALRTGGRLFMREPFRPSHGIAFDDALALARDADFELVSRSQERVFTMGPVFRAAFRKT